MKVLVVGSGGREHALAWSFSKSPGVSKIYCARGNAGMAGLATCIDISPDDIEGLSRFAASESIGLTFVGGESSLAAGISDEFNKLGLKIIGPSKNASQLEASKAFAKDFMTSLGIPTANYKVASSPEEAIEALESGYFGGEDTPVVVKADGLAAGKGVVLADSRSEATEAIRHLEKVAGREAASKIILEETLSGDEVSLLLFSDGENFALMPPARDHKRIGENDTGPNTGGMGAFTDKSLLTAKQIEEVKQKIVLPTLLGCREAGNPFKGVLFIGLMLTPLGIKVLEYNVRFGDPETQAILPMLETGLLEICLAILEGTLDHLDIRWKEGSSACVVLASEGYPSKPVTGFRIEGAGNCHVNTMVFHAGTSRNEQGDLLTSGGRVLAVSSTGENLATALGRAYDAVGSISWEGMQFRRDIGRVKR